MSNIRPVKLTQNTTKANIKNPIRGLDSMRFVSLISPYPKNKNIKALTDNTNI